MIRTWDRHDLPQLLLQAHDVFAELNVVHPGGDTEDGGGGLETSECDTGATFSHLAKGVTDWITESVECVHAPQDGGMGGGAFVPSPSSILLSCDTEDSFH